MTAAVVISGGAEIGALAVAEALHAARIPYHVLSLVPNSMLRNAPGMQMFADVHSAARDPLRLRDRLLDCLARWHRGSPLVAFATEDGGLRCLNEHVSDVLNYAEFPRARALRMGGLDKAELFEHLANAGLRHVIPDTRILHSLHEFEDALASLGDDTIFKPALKPFDMDLRAMGSKIVTREQGESTQKLRARLQAAWHLSESWVAQARLMPYASGERGVWFVHGHGEWRATQFAEHWKYPSQGGTGCWVSTDGGSDLMACARAVAQALDYVGLAEIPFLRDASGLPRMLELNARAWLQVGLGEHSGLNGIAATVSLFGGSPRPPERPFVARSWVNLERCALALASPGHTRRSTRLRELLGALRQRPIVAVYGSSFPRMTRRWLTRLVRRAFQRGQVT